jgi:hypothetical protein
MAVVTAQLNQDYGVDYVINSSNNHFQKINRGLQKVTPNLAWLPLRRKSQVT